MVELLILYILFHKYHPFHGNIIVNERISTKNSVPSVQPPSSDANTAAAANFISVDINLLV